MYDVLMHLYVIEGLTYAEERMLRLIARNTNLRYTELAASGAMSSSPTSDC